MLNYFIIFSQFQSVLFQRRSKKKEFILYIITDALMTVFTRLTVEKNLTTVQLVMGRWQGPVGDDSSWEIPTLARI